MFEGLEVIVGAIADASTVMSSKGETTVVDVVSKIASAVATKEAMLVERRLASTVSDTISAEEIRGGTSSDASEAIEKVTGVTTMNDFVFVRGLDPRYSGTTLNNALLASTEPECRVVPLDLFPASLIDNIKVQKTYSPHLPGEFSAGLVQVETTEFPTRPTLNVSYSIGYNDQTQGHTFLGYPGGGRDFWASTTARAASPIRSQPTGGSTASRSAAASCRNSGAHSAQTGSAFPRGPEPPVDELEHRRGEHVWQARSGWSADIFEFAEDDLRPRAQLLFPESPRPSRILPPPALPCWRATSITTSPPSPCAWEVS